MTVIEKVPVKGQVLLFQLTDYLEKRKNQEELSSYVLFMILGFSLGNFHVLNVYISLNSCVGILIPNRILRVWPLGR